MDGVIPVIDFSAVCGPTAPTDTARQELADQIFKAMSQVGFLYLVNHGVEVEKVNAVFEESSNFFRLPADLKVKYNVKLANGYGGYTQLGKHIFNEEYSHEMRECFSIDNPDTAVQVGEAPALLPAIEELRRSCQPVVRSLLTLIGKALKLEDEEYFLKAYNGGNLHQVPSLNRSMMRTSWYPAIPKDLEIVSKTVRCNQHTDYGILTLLFQDEVGGLEVKCSDGSWMEAKPIPGSILINTGDILHLWTGGTLPATPHRVLIPDKEIQLRNNRQSVIFLVHADDNALVAPIQSPLIKYDGGDIEPVLFKVHYERRMNMNYGAD